jgi:DNA-binding HxlR family transcriptional regulator
MAAPRPGKAVRGSTTGRPIMALLDLLGRRWALRILWELRNEPATFRSLRQRCDALSPSVLNLRLAELRAAGIVRLDTASGYGLTEEGKNLIHALAPLNDWARRWQRRAMPK